ncbi:hypothetical protein ZWY2020_004996 [Hordeum vulgare]|nr:hypothetical protein ZWY2020_004996 [Hordeum vulgare]
MREKKYSRGCAEEVVASLGLPTELVKQCMGDPSPAPARFSNDVYVCTRRAMDVDLKGLSPSSSSSCSCSSCSSDTGCCTSSCCSCPSGCASSSASKSLLLCSCRPSSVLPTEAIS